MILTAEELAIELDEEFDQEKQRLLNIVRVTAIPSPDPRMDLGGGVRRLRHPLPACSTCHAACDCRESRMLQGLEWVVSEIVVASIKRDDAPYSSEMHLASAVAIADGLIRDHLRWDAQNG